MRNKAIKIMIFKYVFIKFYDPNKKTPAKVHKQKDAHFLVITADQHTSWQQCEETIFLFKNISKQHLGKGSLQIFRIQWVENMLLGVNSDIKTNK